jgi:hypothetical protein
MQLKTFSLILAAGVLLLGGATIGGRLWYEARHAQDMELPAMDTVRVTVTDTVRLTRLQPKDTVVVRRQLIRTPVYYHDTLIDTVRIEVPIQQHHYQTPEADVWISGLNARLDSIYCYQPVTKETVTELVPVKKDVNPWALGVTLGAGITPLHGVQPTLTVGITYNLLNF